MNQDFDWVTATMDCSLSQCFERLKLQTKADVEKRQTARSPNSPFGFTFISNGREFSAILEGNNLHRVVTFSLGMNSITVRDEKDVALFAMQPTISDSGECKLKVKEQELEFWQCRKRALEALFFAVETK